ncbi:MAG TPA: RICIN domain-containing protein [Polyangium sp.]|nr:RICIN domain-containing protein [Polyangium sp.]
MTIRNFVLGCSVLALAACSGADDDFVEENDANIEPVIVSNVTDGLYILRSVATNKCLDVAYSNKDNGGKVHEWTCNGTNAQVFQITAVGGGFFKIVNVNSNKAIDIKDVSTSENALVQQWDYGGGPNQQFKFVPRGNNQFSIHARHTDMVIDLFWGKAEDGTPLVQYPYIGGANQRWLLDKIGSTGGGGGTTGGGGTPTGGRALTIRNNCSQPIWVAHSQNVQSANNVKLNPGGTYVYNVPENGISATRFWPKTGCNENGTNCKIGDSVAPCPAGGCQPPIESKFEATFAAKGGAAQTWYNLSQVDGYTLPFKVVPTGEGAGTGNCVVSDCSGLSLDRCPGSEDLGNGVIGGYAGQDLRVRDSSGAVIGCMAPCKKWNYPAPWGLGKPENGDPGLHLCCPTPIDPASGQCTVANGCMTSQACSNAGDPLSVEHTDYVNVMRQMCPTAYSYAYDDAAGLHACPSTTSFEVTFCP